MYQFELLTNFNIKKTNQNSSSSRTAITYPEPEFSYNDVLQDELFRSFRQHKRNNSNNSRNNTTSNDNANFNSSSSRSVPSSHGTGFISPSNYPSNYSTGLTPTSNFSYDKETLMDWIKKLIEEKTVTKGDANGDGVVDLNDLKTMVDRMFDDTVDVKMKNVDFNGDGKITLQDISEVIKLLVKPEEKVIKGDVNDDGVVDNKDLITLVKYLHDKNTKINFKNADIDDNGEIKLDDVSELIAIINRQKQNTEPDVPVEPDPPKKEILKGDVNGDGKVTQADVYTLNQYYVGNTTNIDMDNADMNDDGRISLTDIDRVQNLVNKLYPDMGDVNDDGVINQKDAEAIKSYRMGYNVKINMDKADMDGDGEITMADISRVQQLADELDPRVLKGDANDDGKVNYKDVDLMLKKLQGRNVNINMDAVDMNYDTDFDMKDLVRLRNLVLEQEEKVQTLRGDSNGDGVVDQRDYDNVQNFINDVKSSEDFILKNSDINGDGKIDDEDLKSLRNLTLNDDIKINYSERTHLGDVNGDGIISIADAQAITNYNNHRSTGKEFYIKNADVNNDGKIDKEDVTAITDLLRNVRTVARELPVWSNVELTNKNGDIVRPGDNVIFLERENDSYKIQYKTASGEEKIGWVHRFVFDPIPDPEPDPKTIVDPPFTSGRAIRNTQAWNNPELTIPYSDQYEGLFAGETFKVKAMTLDRTAFQVEYDSIYGGTKTRWVSAADIEEYKEHFSHSLSMQKSIPEIMQSFPMEKIEFGLA